MIHIDKGADTPGSRSHLSARPAEFAHIQDEADVEMPLGQGGDNLARHGEKRVEVRNRVADMDGDVLAQSGKIVAQREGGADGIAVRAFVGCYQK